MEIVKDRRVSAIIDYAADLLDKYGWAKGALWPGVDIPSGDAVHWDTDMSISPVQDGAYVGDTMCTEGALRLADLMVHTDIEYPMQSEVFPDVLYAVHSLVPDFTMKFGGYIPDTREWKKRPSVAMWNDFACTSKEEAVAFLRDCAIKTSPDETRGGVPMSE